MNHPRPHSAFTLLEMMIAIAIFSMVMAAIYGSWSAIMRGSKAALDAAADVQRARISVDAIKESLMTAQYYQANPAHYEFVADTSEEFASLSLVGQLPSNFPGSGLFGNKQLRRVMFSVEPNTNGFNELVLRQVPLLEVPFVEEPYPIRLAPKVQQFTLEFWDPGSEEWMDEWTATHLPPMVRFTLGLGQQPNSGEPQYLVIKTVSLQSQGVPVPYQVPRGFTRLNQYDGQPQEETGTGRNRRASRINRANRRR